MDTSMSDEIVDNNAKIESDNQSAIERDKNPEMESERKSIINTENETESDQEIKSEDKATNKTPIAPTTKSTNFSCLTDPLSVLNNINSLKNAICELPLDPCEQKYIEVNITPLLNVIDELSRISSNLSNSVDVLSSSVIVCPNRCELEQTLHFIYDINNKCEELFCNVDKRIDTLLCRK